MPYAVEGFFLNGGQGCCIARVIGKGAGSASTDVLGLTIRAVGPGAWGNRVVVRVEPGTTLKSDGTSAGFRLRAYYWAPRSGGGGPAPEFDASGNVANTPEPEQVEDFDDLSLDESHPDYWNGRVNRGTSSLIEIVAVADGTELPAAVAVSALEGAAEGAAPVLSDFCGEQSSDSSSGLRALELDTYRDVALVHAPNVAQDITDAVVAHCEKNKYRFAVVDCEENQADVAALAPPTTTTRSTRRSTTRGSGSSKPVPRRARRWTSSSTSTRTCRRA